MGCRVKEGLSVGLTIKVNRDPVIIVQGVGDFKAL